MKRILLLTVFALLLMAPSPITKVGSKPGDDFTDMHNPASRYCLKQGHVLEIRDGELGQYGICINAPLECDEWEFFYGTCSLELGRFSEVK